MRTLNYTVVKWLSLLSPNGLDEMSLRGCKANWCGKYEKVKMSELHVKTLETSASVCVNTSLLRCIKAKQIIFRQDEDSSNNVSLRFICVYSLGWIDGWMDG